jgi:hypothetical protein
MLLLQQENDTGGLSVERAGDVENGVLDNALNGIIGDRALGLKTVEGTAGLDQLKESGGGGVLEAHCEGEECSENGLKT